MAKRPTPPNALGTSGRRFWRDITDKYELENSELLVLTEICATVDRLGALAAAISERGVVDESSSQGLRASPLLVEERQQRMLLAKLITALGLPLGSIENTTTAKGTTPIRGRGLYGLGA